MAAEKTSAKKSAAKKSSARKASAKTAARKAAGRTVASKSDVKHASAKSAATKTRSASRTAAKAASKVPGKRSAPKKTSSPDKYTDPALRERIKAKVIREDRGGRPGQWSARKAQMVAHEYEAEGGKYKGGRGEAQQNLTAWGDEHWTTQDGKPAGRKDGMHRYLPEKAWEKLSPAEKRATEKKKLAGDKKGKQFVANTGAAVKARRGAEEKSKRA